MLDTTYGPNRTYRSVQISREAMIVVTGANADCPGQVMPSDVEQFKSEAMMVRYAVIVEEHEEGGEPCIERLEVPGSLLHAVLRVLMVPGISLEHGLRPRHLRILAITPIGASLEERVALSSSL